jgi:ParB-like chromosome segregation protein Spo0J
MKSVNQPVRRGQSRRAKLRIVYRQVETLKLDPGNPRVHSKKQIRQIANSIRVFGFNVPILIDRHNNVIAGHGRLLACRELGIAEVPTLRLDHLTPAQVDAFMIAVNRLTEIGSWDDRLLAQQLKDLSLLDLEFSIEITGFEMAEIDLRIASLDGGSRAGCRSCRCGARAVDRPVCEQARRFVASRPASHPVR